MNIGVSPATVEAFGCDLARRDGIGNWVIPGLETSPLDTPDDNLDKRPASYLHDNSQKLPDTFDEKFSDACGNQQLCAVGAVRYIDGNGIARALGFFRVYDNSSKSFVASKNNEEEYQD